MSGLLDLNGMSTMEAATAYLDRGWSPTPTRDDVPLLPNWGTVQLTPQHLELFNNTDIGLVLGLPSGGLHVVMTGAPTAIHLAQSCLPSTLAIAVRLGLPGSQYFYHVSDPVEHVRYLDVDGDILLELRSDGQLSIAPPSRYGTNGCAKWEDQGPPAKISASELTKGARRLAAHTLVSRHWNFTQELALALAGGLLRAGWHPDDVANLVSSVAAEAGDQEVQKRLDAVYQTHKKRRLGEYVTGFPTVGKIIGYGVVDSFRAWLELGDDTIPIKDSLLVPIVDTEWPPSPDCPYHKPLVSQRSAFKVWVKDCEMWSCGSCAEDKARAILRKARQLFTSEVWYGGFPLNPKLFANLRQRRKRGGAPSLWVKRDDALHVFSTIDLRGNSSLTTGGNFLPPDAGRLFLQQIAMRLPGPIHVRRTGSWSPLIREDKKRSAKWDAPVGNVTPGAAKYIKDYLYKNFGVTGEASSIHPDLVKVAVKAALDQYLSR